MFRRAGFTSVAGSRVGTVCNHCIPATNRRAEMHFRDSISGPCDDTVPRSTPRLNPSERGRKLCSGRANPKGERFVEAPREAVPHAEGGLDNRLLNLGMYGMSTPSTDDNSLRPGMTTIWKSDVLLEGSSSSAGYPRQDGLNAARCTEVVRTH